MTEENVPVPAAEIEVDIYGEKVKVSKERADKIIAMRQAGKAEVSELTRRLGSLEAEKSAAEQARAKAENDAAHAAAIKAGEIDKAREIAAKGANDKLSKLSSKYRDQALENQLRAMDGIVKEAIPDIVAQLKGSCNFNLDSESLEVMDAAGKPLLGDDGKPVQADAYMAKFLENRPYFRRASQAPGSGSSGSGKSPASVATMTEAMAVEVGAVKVAAFLNAGGKIVG